MRTERIEKATPELKAPRSSPDSQTPATIEYVISSRGNPLEVEAGAGRPHRLPVRTLVVLAAGAYTIGVLALFTQRCTVAVAAAALFQLTLVATRFRSHATASATSDTGATATRTGRVTASRAEAWLLTESLADLSSRPLPRPSGPDTGDHAIISRRNRSALEFFPSEDASRQALDQVLRQHPHLQGRFAIAAVDSLEEV